MTINSPISLVIFALNIIVSVIAFKNPRALERCILRPDYISGRREYQRLIASGSVHVKSWHLALNMIKFYFCGFPPEERIGSLKFVQPNLIALVHADIGTAFKH